MASTPVLQVQLLGEFQVVYGNTPLTSLDTPRLQSLFALLVLRSPNPLSRQQLASLFWPETSESQAFNNLRSLVLRLRAALPVVDYFLKVERTYLQWREEATYELDVDRFQKCVAQAAQYELESSSSRACEKLEQAAGLYQGNLLPGCFDEWVLPERERLSQLYSSVLQRLIILLEQSHQYPAAIAYAQQLQRYDPLNETTYQTLMRLLSVRGDRAGALRWYHKCTTVLKRELGVEPDTSTQALYKQVLRKITLPDAPTSLAANIPLVGRSLEWSKLQEAWHSAQDGQVRIVLIKGEAGIGKTRLAEEMVNRLVAQGLVTARANCYNAPNKLPYAPVTEWLRSSEVKGKLSKLNKIWLTEIARLVPELLQEYPHLTPPGPLTENWQLQRIYEALAKALAASRLLLLEDMQWCDAETLAFLHYLLHFQPKAPLVLVTLRSEELVESQSWLEMLAEQRRADSLVEIELLPLSEPETGELARQLGGREPGPAFLAWLYRETEGNPLFIVETVRAGLPARLEGGDEKYLPAAVQAVITRRLSSLSRSAQELVVLGATIGRSFTYSVLTKASGLKEEKVIEALDELWRRRIIREETREDYYFTHHTIQEVAYAGLSATRCRYLHRQVAGALREVYSGDLDEVRGQLATHYEMAGLLEEAAGELQKAAEGARKLFANNQACDYLKRAVQLLQNDAASPGKRQSLAQIYESLAEVLFLTGTYQDSVAAYHSALDLLPEGNVTWRARLWRKIATTYSSKQMQAEALEAVVNAEKILGEPAGEPERDWWEEWCHVKIARTWVFYYLGQLDQLGAVVEKIRPLVEKYSSWQMQAAFYAALIAFNLRRDHYAISQETLNLWSAIVAIGEATGDTGLIIANRFGVGFGRLWRGELEQAEEELEETLALARRAGDPNNITLCLTYLSILFRLKRDPQKTRRYSEEALTAATSFQMKLYLGLAKANLAWLRWSEGDFEGASSEGSAALELASGAGPGFPFMWLILWPLICIKVSQGVLDSALDYALRLLSPTQVLMPEELREEVEKATKADRPELATLHLNSAIELARKHNYL